MKGLDGKKGGLVLWSREKSVRGAASAPRCLNGFVPGRFHRSPQEKDDITRAVTLRAQPLRVTDRYITPYM